MLNVAKATFYDNMETIKISENERKVLEYLYEFAEEREDGQCTYTRYIAKHTGLDEKKARRPIRALVRKGLVEYHRGLFDDDGMIAGSGYCISRGGQVFLHPCIDCKTSHSRMIDGRCWPCWDTRKCTKCGKAYRDHESDWSKGGNKIEFEFPEELEQLELTNISQE